MKTSLASLTLAALCALSLSGCIDSNGPILTGAQPEIGQRLKLQLYSLHKGHAGDPEQATFTWNGKLYARSGDGMKDVHGFSLYPFENGSYIVQSVPERHKQMSEYALMRPLTDGVYYVVVINKNDADATTRSAHCTKQSGASCRIASRDALFAFARATAARRNNDGGLAIRLAQ